MTKFDRRRFVQTNLQIAASVAAGQAAAGQAANAMTTGDNDDSSGPPPPPPGEVTLGGAGITMSRLGIGTGTKGGERQSNQTRQGFERLTALFRHAYDRGITFFDLADLYGSHVYFREALRHIPREKATILTKVWWKYDGPVDQTHLPHRRQDAEATLERFRHELDTDYLDIVLLHCLTDPAWPDKMQPYIDTLSEQKQAGKVKAVGVSCHDFGALKTSAAAPWVDVILARINPAQIRMDAPPEEVIPVLRQAKAAGKTVLGMKILGEGQLADDRDRCIQYAMGHDFMDAMTIGFESPEQIDEVLTLMDKHRQAATS